MNIPNFITIISPRNFTYNFSTEKTNSFQKRESFLRKDIKKEFSGIIKLLLSNNINFAVISESNKGDIMPDSIFSNNTHINMPDGVTYTSKMLSSSRQLEVCNEMILSSNINDKFKGGDYGIIEGTGSLVIDYKNKIIYASLSERTSESAVIEFAITVGYSYIIFETKFKNMPIYHTNVVMSIGEDYAIICPDIITHNKQNVIEALKETKKVVISITQQQMSNFCGNCLEVVNCNNTKILLMSTRAYNSFSKSQLNQLNTVTSIKHTDISNIEKVGGGSLRCVLTGKFV